MRVYKNSKIIQIDVTRPVWLEIAKIKGPDRSWRDFLFHLMKSESKIDFEEMNKQSAIPLPKQEEEEQDEAIAV